MNPLVVIRRARVSDAESLRALYRQLDDVHAVAEPDVVPTFDEAPRRLEDIRDTIVAGQRPMWVAVTGDADGPVVGFAEVRIIELGDLFRFPRVPEVENLAVDEAQRGRGIGRLLLRETEEWARSEGMIEMWISAWDFNAPAAGLYRSEGFRPLSTRFRKPITRLDCPGYRSKGTLGTSVDLRVGRPVGSCGDRQRPACAK